MIEAVAAASKERRTDICSISRLDQSFPRITADIAEPCCQSPATAQASLSRTACRFARRCGID
jgi:hypothetical protein